MNAFFYAYDDDIMIMIRWFQSELNPSEVGLCL